MKFRNFVKTEAIKVGLQSTDKESVIRELVVNLIATGQLKQEEQENIIQAILKREELGSTRSRVSKLGWREGSIVFLVDFTA